MKDYFFNVTKAYEELKKEVEKSTSDKYELERLLVELEEKTSQMLYRVSTKMITKLESDDVMLEN